MEMYKEVKNLSHPLCTSTALKVKQGDVLCLFVFALIERRSKDRTSCLGTSWVGFESQLWNLSVSDLRQITYEPIFSWEKEKEIESTAIYHSGLLLGSKSMTYVTCVCTHSYFL